MDFNVKKIVKDAGAALSRVVQMTEEKLGTSEKTELDAHFENLWERAESTKNMTDRLVKGTEAVLIPNPGNRIEDYIYEKIEKKKPSRLSNLEYLGLDMIEAGQVFGPGTAYGSSLIKVGQWEQKLGQIERDFIGSAGMCFTQPLRKYLDTEMKTILKEKSLLETKRLDLDACKNRVRKARSLLGTQTKEGVSPEEILEQAERDLRIAQSEFDRQGEITKLLLEGVSSSHAGHLRCLQEFVETQARFYSQCTTIMTDLQRELSSSAKAGPVLRLNSEDLELVAPNNTRISSPATFTSSDDYDADHYVMSQTSGVNPNANNPLNPGTKTIEANDNGNVKKARVLYDYDAQNSSELSLLSDEVILITELSDSRPDEDYVLGERGSQKGKVPRAYLETLS